MTRKYITMNFVFVDMIVAGCVCLYLCFKYDISWQWCVAIGGMLAAVAMFVGMILAFMAADDRERDKRAKVELNYQKQLQQVVMNERINCAKVAVNMAKAMTDRVANTVVSKYVDGLSDEGKRNRVLGDVNNIVNSEIQSLTNALFDELKSQQKES